MKLLKATHNLKLLVYIFINLLFLINILACSDGTKEIELGKQYYLEHNYKAAVEEFKSALDTENPKAFFYLSLMYYNGHGVEKNILKSKELAEKGLHANELVNGYILGSIYESDDHGLKDSVKSQRYYKESFSAMKTYADSGDYIAQRNLGYMYKAGKGTEIKIDEAVKWYTKASNQGYDRAMLNLGYLYQTGTGVNKDITKAIVLYKESSNKSNGLASYLLGDIYLNGKQNDSPDLLGAVDWFKKGCENKHELSCHVLESIPPPQIITDLEKQNLRGPIQSQLTIGTLGKFHSFYNRKGMLIKQESPLMNSEYYYSKEGLLLRQQDDVNFVINRNKKVQEYNYNYGYMDYLVSRTAQYEDAEKPFSKVYYQYNKFGKLSKITEIDEELKLVTVKTYYYSPLGKLEREVKTVRSSEGEFKSKTISFFDKKLEFSTDQVIEMQLCNENDNCYTSGRVLYDRFGHTEGIIMYNNYGQQIQYIHIIQDLDDYQNSVREVSLENREIRSSSWLTTKYWDEKETDLSYPSNGIHLTSIPGDWIKPSLTKKHKGEWGVYDHPGSNKPFFVKADVDKNGIEDEIWILINRKNSDKGIFAVKLNTKNNSKWVVLEDDFYPYSHHVSARSSSTIGSIIDDREEIVSTGVVLGFGQYESSGYKYYWKPEERRFYKYFAGL